MEGERAGRVRARWHRRRQVATHHQRCGRWMAMVIAKPIEVTLVLVCGSESAELGVDDVGVGSERCRRAHYCPSRPGVTTT